MDMLHVGRERYEKRYNRHGAQNGDDGVHFVGADAMHLPFADGMADAYTISFGLRNVTDIDAALREAFRVLKRGGRLLVMEFSHVENPLLRNVYQQYSNLVIPELGAMVAGDRDSYQYLIESIRKFPKQQDLCQQIKAAGFQNVSYRNLTFGVVAIH